MTPDELLTKKDLEDFKREILELLAPITKGHAISQQKWLKSMDVRKILGISHNKLQQLRNDGTLPYHKLGGIIYYKPDELQKAMERAEKKKPDAFLLEKPQKQTFGLIFYLRAPSNNPDAEILNIYIRLTMNGKRLEWSTQRRCRKTEWDNKGHRMIGSRNGSKETNNWLEILNARAFEARQELYAAGKPFTNQHVRKLMQGEDLEPAKTLAEVWQYHTENITSLIGKGYTVSTLKKYKTCRNALTRYMKVKYKLTDIRLDKLDYQFIKEYEMWLKTDYGVINNTAVRMVRTVRVIIRVAMDYGWLKRDPFLPLRMKLDEVHRDYLTNDELSKLATKRFSPKKLNMVRDLFLFSCYTGLAFSDTLALKQEDIVTGEDGEPWLQTHRIKNNNRVRVPLLAPALKVIEWYKDHPRTDRGFLLPKISNQKANAYLKEITEKLGICKRLTYHCARHTFATTVTLTNGVPIETVGQMLGHKNIRSTQHYARVTDTKVQVDMQPIKQRYEHQPLSLVSELE